MARPTKYLPGRKIPTIGALTTELNAGRYIIQNGKRLHPGWVRSYQLHFVLYALKHGFFRYALRNPDFKPSIEEKT